MVIIAKRSLPLLAMIVACVIALVGCGGAGGSAGTGGGGGTATSTSAANESEASAGGSGSSTSSADKADDATDEASSEADAKRQAEVERLTKLEETYEHTVATKDDWADKVVVDSLNKLVDQGAIPPLPEDLEVFKNVFQFEPADDGYDIVFLDETAKDQLTGDFALDLSDGSKVALCCEYRMLNDDGSRARDVMVPYINKDGAFSTAVYKHDEELLATPTLTPAGGPGVYDTLRTSAPPDVFADSVEECRYLIAYGSCYSNVKEDYYAISPTAEGTIDRVDKTTVVVVFDARESEVLHIENIGTDVPKASGDAAKLENYGKQLTEEAMVYIASILPHD